MANNATFDELTVNTLNIGKTGTMKIRSKSSIDMQVGDNYQISVGGIINNTKCVNIQAGTSTTSPDLFINGKKLTSYLNSGITKLYVNDELQPIENGAVFLTVPTDYLPTTGGRISGDVNIVGTLTIGNSSDNQTIIQDDNINTSSITGNTFIVSNGNDTNTITLLYNSLTIKSSNENVLTLNTDGINTSGNINANQVTANILTDSISNKTNNTAITITDISGADASFDNVTISNDLISNTLTTTSITTDNIIIESTPINDTDGVNKLYVDQAIETDITNALAELKCKVEINLLTEENGFTVYLNKNVPCDYVVTETSILYKSNVNENNAEDVVIEDGTKINLNDTARKKHMTATINNVSEAALVYGIVGCIKVKKVSDDPDEPIISIYTNAEVTSWNNLRTYEKTLPYIWLTNED